MKKHLSLWQILTVLAVLWSWQTACVQHTLAQWPPHYDVLVDYQDGRVVTIGGTASEFHPIFTSNFFLLNGQPYSANPGFASNDDGGNSISEGDLFAIEILPTIQGNFLTYFDPLAAAGAGDFVATSATLQIDNREPLSLNVDPNRFLDVTMNFGGRLDIGFFANTELHEHPKFRLSDTANGNPLPAFGAYGFLFRVHTDAPGIAASDPTWLVFNFGMEFADFTSQAVPRFGQLSAVPEPSALALMSLMGFWAFSRRRSQ